MVYMDKMNTATATDEQIETLRAEAGVAGDAEMVSICDAALDGHAQARIECARVIAEAQAQR